MERGRVCERWGWIVLGLLGACLVGPISAACGVDASANGDDQSASDPSVSGEGSSGGKFGEGSSSVVLEPKHATAIIDTAVSPAIPGAVTFKTIRKSSAGDRDVTSGTRFILDDSSLGTMNGASFTSVPALPEGVAGKSTTVRAETEAGQAIGTLTVVQLRQSGPSRDFFFVVPYQEAPTPPRDILAFSTKIRRADVAFVMDTTGSMGGSINNLKAALQGSLLAQLQAAIPDVGLAVVDHKDFNQFSTFGSPIDAWSVLVRQTMTTNLAAAQNAVGQMSATGGGDLQEAQIGAMHHVLTGAGNPSHPPVAAHSPPAGTFGGVDFRAGSVPIVVEITDAPWRNPAGTVDFNMLKAAFAATNAKFVDITSGDESAADDLSDTTGSNVSPSAFSGIPGCAAGQCCTGVGGAGRAPNGPGGSCRLNFRHSDGNGVSAGVVTSIQAIANGTVFDVKAALSNDPTNEKGVDATKFIKALRAMDEGSSANGCPPNAALDANGDGIKDTFSRVTSGTPVCFEVIAEMNTTVPPELDPKFYKAFIDVIAVQNSLNLDRRAVVFLVPPKGSGVN